MRTATILLCCCALLACGKERAPAGESAGGMTTEDGFDKDCSRCHGSEKSPAPSVDLLGGSDPAMRGVGAHASHVSASHRLSSPVACASCHVVPEAVDSPGHLDVPWPARVTFGGLAAARGAKPSLSAEPGTGNPRADAPLKVSCASVYCHGETLSGGAATAPVWNSPDAKWTRCDACHGFPPAQTSKGIAHSSSTACAHCHDQTASADGAIRDPAKHINGVVEFKGGSCHACHGSADNDAPPLDASGRSETSLASVGAHQSHLKSAIAKVLCTDCHTVPANVDDPGHIGAGAGKVTFAHGRAVAQGAQPTWDAAAATCASVYCHGATLGGGSSSGETAAALVWTRVDGKQATCGSCHGLPPPLPHPQRSKCSMCHGETVAEDNTTFAHPEKHVDGVVQVKGGGSACNSCHGDTSAASPAPGDPSTAPPSDTNGETNTSLATVGAHASHLKAAHGVAAPVACSECHTVPSAVGSPGHNDGEAEVAFGDLAEARGAGPTWNVQEATCATYCHGQTLSGGTNTAPSWTKVDGSQAACGTCHGLPPPTRHPQNPLGLKCSQCHDTVAEDASGNLTIAKPKQHVNGTVNMIGGTTCHSCHGSAANNAPPTDVTRRTEASLVSVGAHQTHLATTRSKPVACSECHPVPANYWHYDGAVDFAFGPSAELKDHAPSFDRASATCANTYCHAPNQSDGTSAGGTVRDPVWIKVDGTQNACGTCHGIPPPRPHLQLQECSECHDTVGPDHRTIVKPAQHVDGVVQVSMP